MEGAGDERTRGASDGLPHCALLCRRCATAKK